LLGGDFLRDFVGLLQVRGDSLQPADRDRLGLGEVLVLDAAAPAGGLAGAIAGASQDSGENVRLPVDEIRVAVAAGGDSSDVFGNRCVGRTRPLAIDDFMKVIGLFRVSRLQRRLSSSLLLLLLATYRVAAGVYAAVQKMQGKS